MTPRIRRVGFTLLEVMVAVAILALSLTAIFASQAGAIQVAHRARKTSIATTLARCKMAEIEQQIFEDGFPAIELADTDGCCEDAEIEGFECEWVVSRVVLPDPDLGDEGGLLESLGGEGEGEGSEPVPPADIEDQLASGAGAADLLGEIVMTYAYPVLKPTLEEQIRRARVRVRWHEGEREHSFDVVQYLVAEPSQLPTDPALTPPPTGGGPIQ
jgi:general secretion pathway protein I